MEKGFNCEEENCPYFYTEGDLTYCHFVPRSEDDLPPCMQNSCLISKESRKKRNKRNKKNKRD